MRRSLRGLLRLIVLVFGVLSISAILQGQAADPPESVPLTTDFSHQHLIFSKPSTREQLGRVQQDVRYWQQLYRREMPALVPGEDPGPNAGTHPHHDWSENMGSGATVGAGNYPAKYSYSLTTANCSSATQPDFTVYNTGLTGSATQASIVAYDNLYSGCTGTVPTTYWAYNTYGVIATSVALSFDGKQVAFVETFFGNAYLVLLKWAASTTQTVGNPGTPTYVSTASYPTCTAPCFAAIALTDSGGNAHNDTLSSVFYVYNQDVAYVGDNGGWLHQFTGVFKGTPTEVRTGGWPVHVSSTKALSIPVHDYASGSTFVGDAGGFLYRVSSGGSVTASGQLDYGTGIVQGPLVDATSSVVYVFASSDGSGACTGGANCSSVYALNFNFAAGNKGTKKTVGISTSTGTTPNPMYIGGFDSTYFNSGNSTGNLYVCGNTGGPPTLYKIAIAAGVLGTVTSGPALSTSTTPCSPVTDVQNPNAGGGPTEWVFVSAGANGIATGCTTGCLYNFKNTPWTKATAYSLGKEVLDSNFKIEVVTTAGTSGTTQPAWGATGTTTTDGTVKWFNQGLTTQITAGTWVRLTNYPVGSTILDSNNNVEKVTTSHGSGNSGGNQPTWNTVVGGTTSDSTLTWTNEGPVSASGLASAGGTSGIIIDNFVSSGTLAGASQIYFSTLTNQTCVTSGGTGGCAMQASQAALK